MNIKEAKEEIIRTVQAYRRKDETGAPEIPREAQRPILLIGPPGIGKTAVMEQVAEECGIGLVSYTITHHTRQSAIGLPMISKRMFDGKEMSVTEYTMSEIVASVYDKMEASGVREGILFLDEINCVSETLAPTMLQFLQYKTFGTHQVPEGWVIVTAGNQPQYNRSAREFDIVTLDRVRRMEIRADFGVWKEYAIKAGVHGAILAYLEMKPQHFYVVRTEVDARHFVTARGWEDLSRMIYAYEGLGEAVTEQMASQYLQDPDIARDFAVYYELYRKYRERWRIRDILDGKRQAEREEFLDLPFDEKLSLIRLMADGLHLEFARCALDCAVQELLQGRLLGLKGRLEGLKGPEALREFRRTGEDIRRDLDIRLKADMIGREAARAMRLAGSVWEELLALLEEQMGQQEKAPSAQEESGLALFGPAREWFSSREDERLLASEETGRHLSNAILFLEGVYGDGQEIIMLLTELHADGQCLDFIRREGNETYERCSRMLMLHERQEELRMEILNRRTERE